jgi:hypothetical protein
VTKTSLFFTVFIPVTYDERYYTEEQALDATQRAAEEAIRRACDGRSLDGEGRHTDCRGPSLVKDAAPTLACEPPTAPGAATTADGTATPPTSKPKDDQ